MNKNEACSSSPKPLQALRQHRTVTKRIPKDFAHINIFFRPFPGIFLKAPGFYSEQCYDYASLGPYRQGIHRLLPAEKRLLWLRTMDSQIPSDWLVQVESPNHECNRFHNPEERCGCAMHFHRKNPVDTSEKLNQAKLHGSTRRKTHLSCQRSGCQTQENWISRDRGFDPNTDEQIWGSEHGLLRIQKNHFSRKSADQNWLQNSKT